MGIPMPHGSGAPPMPRAYSSQGLRKSMSAASFASSTHSRAQSGDLKSERLRAMAQAAGLQANEYVSRSQVLYRSRTCDWLAASSCLQRAHACSELAGSALACSELACSALACGEPSLAWLSLIYSHHAFDTLHLQARLQRALEWQMRTTASKAALALQAEVRTIPSIKRI